MATKLEAKLNRILNEKTEKIIPANIRAGVNIFGIEGGFDAVETQDATATADDILMPQTAYVNNKKLLGKMKPEYETVMGEVQIDTGEIVNDKKIYDINEEYNLIILGRKSGNGFSIYNFENGSIGELITEVETNRSTNPAMVKLSKTPLENGNLLLAYSQFTWVSGQGDLCYFVTVEWDIANKRIAGNYASTSSSKLYVASISINPVRADLIHVHFCSKSNYSGDWDSSTIYKRSGNTLSAIKTVNYSHNVQGGGEWNADGTKLIIFKGRFTSSRTNMMYYEIKGDTALEITDKIDNTTLSIYDKYLIQQNKLYEGTTLVKDWSEYYTVGTNYNIWTYNNLLFVLDWTTEGEYTYKVFIINEDLSLTYKASELLSSTPSTLINTPRMPLSNETLYYFHTTSKYYHCTILDSVQTLKSITRKGITFYNTADAGTSAMNVLEGKKAYTIEGKITGTMPNIGAVDYTPSTEDYVIPLGYTTGGTIKGDVNLLAQNIRADKTLFGIQGTAPVTFSTIEEMQAKTDLAENTIAIVFGTKYVGTYKLDNGSWTEIGKANDEVNIMDTLNQTQDIYDDYEGPRWNR